MRCTQLFGDTAKASPGKDAQSALRIHRRRKREFPRPAGPSWGPPCIPFSAPHHAVLEKAVRPLAWLLRGLPTATAGQPWLCCRWRLSQKPRGHLESETSQ